MNLNRYILIAFAAIFLSKNDAPLQAEDRHYMLIFASHHQSDRPPLCHTFALFVKATEKEQAVLQVVKSDSKVEQLKNYDIETHSISWMPQSLDIEPLRRTPVRGINLDLAGSIRLANSQNAPVTMWGPFLIKKELYDMAVQQEQRLNRGAIGYIMLDRRYRGQGASNCIHAVSDLDTTQPALLTGTAHGEAASMMVLRHLERYILPSQESTSWLCEQLKLSPLNIRFATEKTILARE